jgi:putative phosphoesterase
MRLLCLSDIHGYVRNVPVLIERELGEGVDCIVICGDLTQMGDYSDARDVAAQFMMSGIRIFAVHGNMDTTGVLRFLEDEKLSIHGRSVDYAGVTFIGLGGGGVSPFNTPAEYSESEMAELLARSIRSGSVDGTRILVSHTPPYGTRLDRLSSGKHVGSSAVKDFIKSENINLCISGHIHESRGIDDVERCSCVNAGAFKAGNYCIIDIDPGTGLSTIHLKRVDDLWKKKQI